MDKAYLLEFFQSAGVTTALIFPMVMGLVTYYGKFGITGKWQLVSSMVTGLVLGGFVMYVLVVPATLIQYTAVGLYGLTLGLGASGVYETGKEIAVKAAQH